MGKINVGRWIAGGIVAGILVNISETVLNVVVLRGQWESAMKALGKAQAESGSARVVWMIWGLAYGLICVWLYAAIRPRFGPGAGTALKAGFAAWLLACLLSAVGLANMRILPSGILTTSAIWSLVESLVATTVGAWIYRETEMAAPAAVGARA
jgi:hypothetical protein